MSNRKKTMRVKTPAPTRQQAVEAFEKAAADNPAVVVPGEHDLTRRTLRSMRRRVPVMSVLGPALDANWHQPAPHQHNPNCSHYAPEETSSV